MDVVVEGDWSAAAFILVAGAVAGTLTVTGLDQNSAQADVAVLVALGAAGADVRVAPGLVTVGPGELRGFAFDATECPDLFPPLAVLALHCAGETRLKGVGRLAVKESDRGRALVEELGAIGGNLTIVGDELVIHGGRIRGGRVDARGDHRIAMATAVAALCAEGHVDVEGAGCVEKSYPGFFDDLKRIGASVS
jgi:3-phosphoshikimate 1-carboxyvinyltransferase